VVRTELVRSAQSGDRQAFDALAAGMYDRLYAVARRILRDGYAAEEAVQESLIRAWRELRSLRDPSRFEAWMHRLLVNACHDQGRKARRFAPEIPEISFDPSDPADAFAAVVNVDELERGFLRLSIDHRAVLVLTHYVGMSAPEVSQVLGIPVGTVHSRLHYGVRAMHAALSELPSAPSGALPVKTR
jgi:RNA polymerase sigma-70 factor (ECF subfamily)